MNCDPALEIGQDCSAIFVNGQQEIASGGQIEAVDASAVGKWQGIGGVTGQEMSASPPDCLTECTYWTRSKTETRLPTGESKQVPSGVKSRFPLRYTVPKRLENWAVSTFVGHIHIHGHTHSP